MSPAPEFSELLLDANLRLLCNDTPELGERIRSAAPHPNVQFALGDDGALTGTIEIDAKRVQLASLRRPVDEGAKLAATIDLVTTSAVFVAGFGLGYHVQALAQRLTHRGILVVFEPDVSLLREVLGRVDFRSWLSKSCVALICDPEDQSAISRATHMAEGVLASGSRILEHPLSRRRLGGAVDTFGKSVGGAMQAVRMNVVTALCQVELTLVNTVGNVWSYASTPGIAELKDSAKGRPAVVVSAGPSLSRNIDQLTRPGVRDRVVIVAVQTVLKTLLEHGIRPHFVTALDYAAQSARFYEGLTAGDVEGVTLVFEPKVNPAVIRAFPGLARCSADGLLNDILGADLARSMGELPGGSTVAHLSYYLARFLGCDPVILIGQDLGFTDGQYYAAGAGIHQVWSGELGEFNTLEMLEWQRIMRMGQNLNTTTDHLGRKVYSDEQMRTYRIQFEREFHADAARGLITIDATEGGVLKQHTRIMTLAAALELFAPGTIAPWSPPTPPASTVAMLQSDGRRRKVAARLRQVWRDAGKVGELAVEAGQILDQIKDAGTDYSKANPLIEKVQGVAARAREVQPAHRLVHHLNQTGTLRRFRKDREIEFDTTLNVDTKHKRQIERDRDNVEWLKDSAQSLQRILDRGLEAVGDESAMARRAADAAPQTSLAGLGLVDRRVAAIVPVDFERGALGNARDIESPWVGGKSVLQWTVARLLASKSLVEVVLLTTEHDRARRALGELALDPRVVIWNCDRPAMGARARAVAGGRLWSRSCWRGGIANLTCFDEAFPPRAAAQALAAREMDAGVFVGADWALIDPCVIDRMIEVFREAGEDGKAKQQIVFGHVAPGLSGCLLLRQPVQEMADSAFGGGPFASIGTYVGYLPMAPMLDPLGRSACVTVSPLARDLGVRCIPDSRERREMLGAAVRGLDLLSAGAGEIARCVAGEVARRGGQSGPEILSLELVGESQMPLALATSIMRQATALREDVALTMTGQGDPFTHTSWRQIVDEARAAGIAGVHARTSFKATGDTLVADILAANLDAISVDVLTSDPAAYRELTGRSDHKHVVATTSELIKARQTPPEGLTSLWIVPRITRRDSEYDRLETFYSYWLGSCGASVIDPLPAPIPGERIEPLPMPACVRERRRRTELVVRADGIATTWDGRVLGDLNRETLQAVWSRIESQIEIKPQATGALETRAA
ncbi:MAG: 6-hydroxymethylpterin diphosphokinase MptE-like protein [Planctomycetota bacterium]